MLNREEEAICNTIAKFFFYLSDTHGIPVEISFEDYKYKHVVTIFRDMLKYKDFVKKEKLIK